MEQNLNFEEVFKQAMSELGQVNILIAGKTGVGKSTLLNAVFGEDFAATGTGRPITQEVKEYAKEGQLYHIFDTKGFELAKYTTMKEDIKQEIKKRQTADPKEHIHIMWYCISEPDARIEDAEIDFMKEMADQIPVIAVLTKAYSKDVSFCSEVEDVLFQTSVQLLRVNSYPFETPIGTVPPHGIVELTEKTYELVPQAAKAAFAAAQKVNKDLRKKAVDKIIAVAATAAGTAGATPIPFSDAVVLAPIQMGMIAKISSTMGLELSAAFQSTIVASAAGVLGGTILGKTIVSNLLKLIPAAGPIIGGVISATTAATLTSLMGKAYYAALESLIDNGIEMTTNTISAAFVQQLKLTH